MHTYDFAQGQSILPLIAFRRARLFLISLVVFAGCSAGEPPAPKMFSSPESFGNLTNAVHSPSAMEAISRGVAAVTPPGAALKDVFYQFDSVELEPEAQEILKKNAEWLKANPKTRVEVEGHCDDTGSAEYKLSARAKRGPKPEKFFL